MLNRTSLQRFKPNKLIIMFMLLIMLLIVLAWWVAEQLIEHIDHNMPGF
jgi:hypothetical protein